MILNLVLRLPFFTGWLTGEHTPNTPGTSQKTQHILFGSPIWDFVEFKQA